MSETATKHQLKKLKKRERREKLKEQRLRTKRQEQIKSYMKYAAAVLVFAFIYVLAGDSSEPAVGSPLFQISPEGMNLGDVSVTGVPVAVSFEIKNLGGSDLIINDMETSCGCTSAAIIYNGVEGPLFNMRAHGTNPTDWSVNIEPGETALLKVIYNPRVHSDLRGAVTRIVTLYTNDPQFKVKDVYIRVNQVG